MARKPQGELARKLAARAYEGHSPLYRWTRAHFAELHSARTAYKPTWQAIADLAAEAGQLDRMNKAPSASAMRKIYLRVERDLAIVGPAVPRSASAARPLAERLRPAASPPSTKAANPEGQNARPAPSGFRGHDPHAREGESEELLGDLSKPRK